MTGLTHATRLRGVDVSGWQKTVDYEALRNDGVHYAWVKSSEGGGSSKTYRQHADGFRSVGIHVGSYHFVRMFLGGQIQDARVQARKWCNHADGWTPGDLPPAIDAEWAGFRASKGHRTRPKDTAATRAIRSGKHWNVYGTPEVIADWLTDFAEEAERVFGVEPIVYTGPSVWGSLVAPCPAVERLRLWVVDYRDASKHTGEPKLPRGFSEWVAWQWTNDLSDEDPDFDAYDGRIDGNLLNGGVDVLERLCGVGAAADSRGIV